MIPLTTLTSVSEPCFPQMHEDRPPKGRAALGKRRQGRRVALRGDPKLPKDKPPVALEFAA